MASNIRSVPTLHVCNATAGEDICSCCLRRLSEPPAWVLRLFRAAGTAVHGICAYRGTERILLSCRCVLPCHIAATTWVLPRRRLRRCIFRPRPCPAVRCSCIEECRVSIAPTRSKPCRYLQVGGCHSLWQSRPATCCIRRSPFSPACALWLFRHIRCLPECPYIRGRRSSCICRSRVQPFSSRRAP